MRFRHQFQTDDVIAKTFHFGHDNDSGEIGVVFNILLTEFAFGCPLGRLALEIEPDRRVVHDKIAANFTGWARAVEELLQQAKDKLPPDCDLRQLSRFVLTVMEGAVMQARSYQCIEPFDDCIAQLRTHFDALLARERPPKRAPRPHKTLKRR